MGAQVISVQGSQVKIELTVELKDSMLESEDAILVALNEAGCLATEHALKRFDTDGAPLQVGETKLYSKGAQPKFYETPYGPVEIERYVYQSARGGKTFCPLERNARIVVSSTPRFAKMVSHKFANLSTPAAREDLEANHGRKVARSFIKDVGEAVAAVVQAKEESWEYTIAEPEEKVATVAIGMDGTCALICEDGWREAMTGTISLYDKEGERLQTIYLGAAPEYGKESFYRRFTREIERVKGRYPNARYVGVADGAAANWDFLGPHISQQILDFYHATGYIGQAAPAAAPTNQAKRKEWIDDSCHNLKHDHGAAATLLNEMETFSSKRGLRKKEKEDLTASVRYFRNHLHQMDYARYRREHLPIGSGVTEAACKTLVKQRLCGAGMRWTVEGAQVVLSLRALVITDTRWDQFWGKVNQYGLPVAA